MTSARSRVTTWFSGHVVHPLWDLKNGSGRLAELRRLERTQWRSLQQNLAAQHDAAQAMLRYAARHCEFYRERVPPDLLEGAFDPDRFRDLPMLEKDDVRNSGPALLSSEFPPGGLVTAKTGGSTGVSLTLQFDDPCQQHRNAAAMRSDRWAGWEPGMKRAALWGNPPAESGLKARLRNALHDRIMYLDTMRLDEASVRDFVARWRREEPGLVYGHSHSIYLLACMLHDLGITGLRPRGIVSTSMMLLAPERRVIEEVFGCRVTDRYGCEEVGLIACQCEQGNGMHVNTDHVYVEILRPDGMPAAPGEQGEVVVTDLVNRGMPMIRYRVGDVGVPATGACPCGRGLPVLERIIGRTADFLVRRDGSLVAGVSLVERTLTAIDGLRQMQIVQDEPGRLELRVVPAADYGPAAEQALRAEFGEAFGPGMQLDIRIVDQLAQDPSGKYRFAVCRVGPYARGR